MTKLLNPLRFKNIITFQATNYRDINVLKSMMGLQELHGAGYYSKSRKDTYQIEHLKGMKSTDILVKRSDVNQTFPVEFEVDDIEQAAPMKMDEITEFMKEQGYDLHLTERRILERTRKTIFEKDFGKYSHFIPEIIKLLNALKTVHKLPISERYIKDELKKVIHEKAKKTTNDNKELKKLKSELFTILITQRYLVEAHPKDAGGQETMRTSYQVGEHYQKALEEYFQTKKEQITDISVEVMEQNTQRSIHIENENMEIAPKIAPEGDNLNKILAKELDALYYELFQIYKHITNKYLKSALDIEKVCIKTFLMNVYQKIYRVDEVITKKDLEAFCNYLIMNQKLPFSQEMLNNYLTYCDTFHGNDGDLETKVADTYNLFSDFFHKVKEQLEINIVRTCEFCGTIIEPDSLYCSGCGVKKK